MSEFKEIEKQINSVEKDLLNEFYEIDNNFKEHPFYVLKEFEDKEV
jgi:cystathionine beta-lyase family protein involved in aluminum resistance